MGTILDIYHKYYFFFFSKHIISDTGLSPKSVNKRYHFPSTAITALLARMDAGSVAAVTGCAAELHFVMVRHCSVSA